MNSGFQRFFARPWTFFDVMISIERGWGRGQKRFSGQSEWLKAEMLDKAACKRKMRAAKRIAEVRK